MRKTAQPQEFRRYHAVTLFADMQAFTKNEDRPEYSPASISGLHEALNTADFTGFASCYSRKAIRVLLSHFLKDAAKYCRHIAALQTEIAMQAHTATDTPENLPFNP